MLMWGPPGGFYVRGLLLVGRMQAGGAPGQLVRWMPRRHLGGWHPAVVRQRSRRPLTDCDLPCHPPHTRLPLLIHQEQAEVHCGLPSLSLSLLPMHCPFHWAVTHCLSR